jgi:hypothetical protein
MKKLAYLIAFLFLAVVGITAYATTVADNSNETTTVVTPSDDEKPKPAECEKKCDKTSAEAKKDCSEVKADCNKEVKADNAAASGCCAKKSAVKTENSTDKSAEKTAEK